MNQEVMEMIAKDTEGFCKSLAVEELRNFIGKVDWEGDFFYWYGNFNSLNDNFYFKKYQKESFEVGYEFFSNLTGRAESYLYYLEKEDKE